MLESYDKGQGFHYLRPKVIDCATITLYIYTVYIYSMYHKNLDESHTGT